MRSKTASRKKPKKTSKRKSPRKPILFVDRDGVLHHDLGDYVTNWEDFRFLPGVLHSLAELTKAGFVLIVISNQAGVGDGVFPKSALDEITRLMFKEVEKAGGKIRKIYYCLHGKNEGCECRKPKTGLFKQAARDFKFDPKSTFFIGDKITDIEAGKKFGLKTIMVLTGYGEAHRIHLTPKNTPDYICPDFNVAARTVLRENKRHPA